MFLELIKTGIDSRQGISNFWDLLCFNFVKMRQKRGKHKPVCKVLGKILWRIHMDNVLEFHQLLRPIQHLTCHLFRNLWDDLPTNYGSTILSLKIRFIIDHKQIFWTDPRWRLFPKSFEPFPFRKLEHMVPLGFTESKQQKTTKNKRTNKQTKNKRQQQQQNKKQFSFLLTNTVLRSFIPSSGSRKSPLRSNSANRAHEMTSLHKYE